MTRAPRTVWAWFCDQCRYDPGYYAITQSELPSPDEMRAKGWHIAPKWGDLCPKCVEKGNQK